jgi:hypothetical protein
MPSVVILHEKRHRFHGVDVSGCSFGSRQSPCRFACACNNPRSASNAEADVERDPQTCSAARTGLSSTSNCYQDGLRLCLGPRHHFCCCTWDVTAVNPMCVMHEPVVHMANGLCGGLLTRSYRAIHDTRLCLQADSCCGCIPARLGEVMQNTIFLLSSS